MPQQQLDYRPLPRGNRPVAAAVAVLLNGLSIVGAVVWSAAWWADVPKTFYGQFGGMFSVFAIFLSALFVVVAQTVLASVPSLYLANRNPLLTVAQWTWLCWSGQLLAALNFVALFLYYLLFASSYQYKGP